VSVANKFELILDDQCIGLGKDFYFDKVAIESCEHISYDRSLTLECSFKLITSEIDTSVFKIFYALPRKEKKRIQGTKSARHKLYKRVTMKLPITLKHFKQAGINAELTIGK
jgi:hypothetical protein